MRLESSLKRWLAQGFINSEAVEAISAFEKERRKGKLARHIMMVAMCAIMLGLLAVVAANWQMISGSVKLIAHFIINMIVAGFMLRVDAAQKPLARDALVLLLSGLFLTFIALIGQVFQLHGDLLNTLTFWFLIITPMVFVYGHGILVAAPYALGFTGLLLDNLHQNLDVNSSLIPLIHILLPLGLLGLSYTKILQQTKPLFAKSFWKVGAVLLIINAFIFSFSFYKIHWSFDVLFYHPFIIPILSVFLLACAAWSKGDPYARLFVGLSLFVPFLAYVFYGFGGFVSATFVFVAYGISIASLASRAGFERASETIIHIVLLRLFIFYFELLGDLLNNGLGLILTGVLLILVVKNFAQIRNFTRKITEVRFG